MGIYGWLTFLSHRPVHAVGCLARSLPAGCTIHWRYHPFAWIDWQVILQNLDKIAVILILSVISLLLNASALEVAVKQDI